MQGEGARHVGIQKGRELFYFNNSKLNLYVRKVGKGLISCTKKYQNSKNVHSLHDKI